MTAILPIAHSHFAALECHEATDDAPSHVERITIDA